MKTPKADPAEVALGTLLDALASLLIALDVTPARLGQIARASFVKASALESRKRSSGRPHLARIAALTGLSRTEVKRIVAANYAFGTLEPDHSPRALRVLSAWRRTAPFAHHGRPRELRIVGAAPSFEALCKHHSGDIPYRVILNELLQRKSVHVVRAGKVVMISTSTTARPGRKRDLTTLIYAASILGEIAASDRVLVRRKEKVVAPSSISAAYVEEAIAGKVSEFLDHLPVIFARSGRADRNRSELNVYALVSRQKQHKRI